MQTRLAGHNHYVQGVTWDPLNTFVVSQSGDRTCRVYGPRPPVAGAKDPQKAGSAALALARDLVIQHTLCKRTLPVKGEEEGEKGGGRGSAWG